MCQPVQDKAGYSGAGPVPGLVSDLVSGLVSGSVPSLVSGPVSGLVMIFLENMADILAPFGMIFFQHDICMGFARGDNFL